LIIRERAVAGIAHAKASGKTWKRGPQKKKPLFGKWSRTTSVASRSEDGRRAMSRALNIIAILVGSL